MKSVFSIIRLISGLLFLIHVSFTATLHAQIVPDNENFEVPPQESLTQANGLRYKVIPQSQDKKLVFLQSVPVQANGTTWGYIGVPGNYFNGYPNKAFVFNYNQATDGSANPSSTQPYGIYRMLFSETPNPITDQAIDTLHKLGNFKLKSIYLALGKDFGTESGSPRSVEVNFHALRGGVALARPFIRFSSENTAAGAIYNGTDIVVSYSKADKHGGRTVTFVSDAWDFIDGLWISTAGTTRLPVLIDNVQFEAPIPMAPETRSGNLQATDIGTGDATIRWVNTGASIQTGSRRLVLIKATDNATEMPPSSIFAASPGEFPAAIPRSDSSPGTNGLTTTYGAAGTDLGDGWYCVYNDSYSNFPLMVTGLTSRKHYRVVVADYNGAKGFQTFMTDPFVEGGNAIAFQASSYPPVVATTGGITSFTEGTGPTFVDNGLTVSDPDHTTLASATVTITGNYHSSEDELALAAGSGIGNIIGSFSNTTGVLTLTSAGATATLPEWQTALRAVTYDNSSANPTELDRVITFELYDGMVNSAGATKTVSVTAVNNAPVIDNLDGDVVTFTEKGPAVMLDVGGDATVSDPDSPDFDGGMLTVSVVNGGVSAEDALSIRDEGTAAGAIGVSGGDVYYGGTPIGLVNGGTDGNDLVVTFLPASNPAAAQALIRNLTYSNVNTENPTVTDRTIGISLQDGDGGTSEWNYVTIRIEAVNDAPKVSTGGAAATFTESPNDEPVPVVVDMGITVSDPDNATLASATVRLANFQEGEDVLAFVNDEQDMGNIVASFSDVTGTLTLTSAGATATLVEWQTALRAVTYANVSQAPNTTDRTIEFVVNDGEADSAPASTTVHVIGVNSSPTIAFNPYIEAWEDTPSPVAIQFTDADAGSGIVTVTFSIPEGRGMLQAPAEAGLDVTLTGSHTVVLQGTIAAINAYVDAKQVVFTNVPNDVADVPLEVSINDNGHTGVGGPREVNLTVPIRVQPIIANVTNVSSTTADGVYGIGSTIEITVTFDVPVNVSGSPTLLLETGGTDRLAVYGNGSGSNILIFSYIVQPGDVSESLEYVSTGAFSTNGGTVRGFNGVDALLTLPTPYGGHSLGSTTTITVDGIPPAAPTNLTAVARDAQAILRWTANTEEDVRSYRVYGGETADPTTLLETVGYAETSFRQGSLTNGTLYYYRITAVDEAGNESVLSEEVAATPVAEQTITFDPLDAATYGDDSILLGATASSGLPVGYASSNAEVAEMYRDADDGNQWKIRILRAGTAEITATQPGNAAFLAADPVTRELTVEKALPVIEAAAVQTHVYDGMPKSIAATTVPAELEEQLQFSPRRDFTTVGAHRVRIYLNENDNYLATEAFVDFSITPAPQQGMRLPHRTVTYDGNAHGLEVEGLPGDATVIYAINGESGNRATGAGAYEVVAVVSRPNHADETLRGTLYINKATAGITAEPIQEHVYDGTSKSVVASLNHDEAELAYSPQRSYADAGTYTVAVTAVETANYHAARAEVALRILPAPQQGLKFEPRTVTYTGQEHRVSVQGLSADASVSYSIDGEPGNGAVDVGSYAVTAVVSRPQHAAETLSTTLRILPAPAYILGDEHQVHAYDGSTKRVRVELSHDEVEPTFSPRASYTDAGSYPIVVTAASSRNYRAVSKTVVLQITPAERSLDFPALPEVIYGDRDFEAGATASSGEAITYTSSNTSVAEINDGGVIRILGSGETTITATVPENANYGSRPAATQKLTVQKAPQEITLSAPAEVNRDAGTVALTATASSELPVTLSVDDPEVATLVDGTLHIHRLGTVRIMATQAGDANHEPAEPQTVVVRVVDPSADFPVRVNQAVSPNGDGINEYLIIEAIKDHPDNRVSIFNRNGTVVWEASGYNNGTVAFRGEGAGRLRIPAGTYFYVAEVKVNGKWEYDKGWFVLRY